MELVHHQFLNIYFIERYYKTTLFINQQQHKSKQTDIYSSLFINQQQHKRKQTDIYSSSSSLSDTHEEQFGVSSGVQDSGDQ